jgi:hypothetical protein
VTLSNEALEGLRHERLLDAPRPLPRRLDVASMSELGLTHLYSGKVRDLYEVDDDTC